jgi:NADPH2:quinone reductase
VAQGRPGLRADSGGGYAEFCITAAGHCLPSRRDGPDPGSLAVETFFTVWINVFQRARLAPARPCWSTEAAAVSALPQSAGASLRSSRIRHGQQRECAACEALGQISAINYRSKDCRGREA